MPAAMPGGTWLQELSERAAQLRDHCAQLLQPSAARHRRQHRRRNRALHGRRQTRLALCQSTRHAARGSSTERASAQVSDHCAQLLQPSAARHRRRHRRQNRALNGRRLTRSALPIEVHAARGSSTERSGRSSERPLRSALAAKCRPASPPASPPERRRHRALHGCVLYDVMGDGSKRRHTLPCTRGNLQLCSVQTLDVSCGRFV